MTYVEDIIIVELSSIDVSITEVAIVTSSVLTVSEDDGSNNSDDNDVESILVNEEDMREVVVTVDSKVDVELTVSEEDGSDDNIKEVVLTVAVGINVLIGDGIYVEKILSVVASEEDDSEVLVIMADDEVMVVLIKEDGSGILVIMADDEVMVVLIE